MLYLICIVFISTFHYNYSNMEQPDWSVTLSEYLLAGKLIEELVLSAAHYRKYMNLALLELLHWYRQQ